MTMHCAITYIDPDTELVGFLLGSDSRLGHDVEQADGSFITERTFEVDKSFTGNQTVGLIRGKLQGNGKDPRGQFLRDLKGLENQFDDIDEGLDFSHIRLLNECDNYGLLLAKQTNGFLDLYTVSDLRERDPHIAKRLHRLTPDTYHTQTETCIWYAPSSSFYIPIHIKQKYDLKGAQRFLELCLTIPDSLFRRQLMIKPDYEPGKPTMYSISFQGIQRIEDRVT